MVGGKCQKCKLYLCNDAVVFFKRLFLQFQEFSSRSSEFKRSRKTKLGNLSKIIHQKLPIFDKNFFIKAQKNSLIF